MVCDISTATGDRPRVVGKVVCSGVIIQLSVNRTKYPR